MKTLKWNDLLCFFLLVNSLSAEVEQITVRWNAVTCYDTCTPLLENNLRAIANVTNLQMNGRSGAAVMGWNPHQTFSYEPFRLASAAAGVRLLDVRVRVRGTIAHDADRFYLVSTGDGARFWLLGPIVTGNDRYVPRYNPESYPLVGPVKAQLLEAEEKGQTVVISGPLYLPNRYPRTLIAEQVKIIAKANEMDNRFQRY